MLTGEELRKIRERRGWSQRAMARRVGVTRNCVSLVENGHRPGSADFWRAVDHVLKEDGNVRRAEFLRLSGGVIASAAIGMAASRETKVARRIFADVTTGNNRQFAQAQTTHETDLTIGQYVAGHQASKRMLSRWMLQRNAPVLAVNAAGVLAKVGDPSLVDDVVRALRDDERVERLYLTAVAARVLRLPWGQAGLLAAADHATITLPTRHRDRLIAELDNPRDGGARWCALTLLGRQAPREQLLHRLHAEPSREVLRDIGVALAN